MPAGSELDRDFQKTVMPRDITKWLFVCFVAMSIVYGLAAFNYLYGHFMPPFGDDVYDFYYLSLINGHMDIAPRIIRYEGHYTPDGVAFVYYGIAPMLVRVFMSPFIEIGTIPLSSLSVWFWSVTGTGIYHVLFARWLADRAERHNRVYYTLQFLIALALWIGGPGFVLASNTAVYQEPISMAYALTAGFVWLALYPAKDEARCRIGLRLVLMALLAAIVLHARPNIAVGLYLVIGLLSLWYLWQDWRRALLPVALAFVMLGLGAGVYLGMNALRMGSAFAVNASFNMAVVQYGPTFLGIEAVDSERASAFRDYGRFNLWRIIPNLVIYLVDFEFSYASAALRWLHAVAISVTVGFVRIEGPSIGVLFLWPTWMIMAIASRGRIVREISTVNILLIGLLVVVVVTLSYGTITLRYRIDMWPLIAVLALLGTGPVAGIASMGERARSVLMVFGVIVVFGVMISIRTAAVHSMYFTYNTFSLPWTDHECAQIMERTGFDAEDLARLCRR